MSEVEAPKAKRVFVIFRSEAAARHPVRNHIIARLELVEKFDPNNGGDSTIARLLASEAKLTKDASGIHLKLGDDEITYGWPSILEARNVPRAK